MDKSEESGTFEVSEKFKEFENQGIAAPQVLTFLDNIATMLRVVASDIDRAITNIEEVRVNETETKVTADAS